MTTTNETLNADLDVSELEITRLELCVKKSKIQEQIAEINSRCSIRLPQSIYFKHQHDRRELIRRLSNVEEEIAHNSAALKCKRMGAQVVKAIAPNAVFNIRGLVEILDKWHAVSMDAKQHSKVRETAWKISQEIALLLKVYFDAKYKEGEAK